MKKVLRWIAIVFVVLFVAAFGYRLMVIDDRNAAVAEEIRANPDGERARRAMLVWLEDGRLYPVNYLHEGDLVFMGIDGWWWREFQGEGAPVKLLIRGVEYQGHARVILDDPAYVEAVFSRLRPTVPAWLPAWLNGKLVVIQLRPPAAAEQS